MFFKYDKETRALIDQLESHLADYESFLASELSKSSLSQKDVRTAFLNDKGRNFILNKICEVKQTATKITAVIPNE
ncbi:MAG: hypothetical protein GY799_33115 [Desulfobulbaceae bacterium]|nr:hypothetical protein [Desulfobulbaceae bacterium]